MLIPYKPSHDKIAMGLISYLDKYKEMSDLNSEMARIKAGDRQLSLWEDEETGNVVGIIGYDLKDEESVLIIRYISLSPSFREEALAFQMISALAAAYPDASISGTLGLSDLLNKWALHEQRTIPNVLDDKKGHGDSDEAE